MAKTVQTVGIIKANNKILLGMKKRGFGMGKWNGFGGKLEKDETIKEAMKRELLEETGICALELEGVGVLDFAFTNSDIKPEVHFFKITKWQGTPIEGEEMKPRWFSIDKIPFDSMWPDDRYWLPMLLADSAGNLNTFAILGIFGMFSAIMLFGLTPREIKISRAVVE